MPRTPPLSVAEASDRTGIPKRTLQEAIARGRLKAHKLAGATYRPYLIDVQDLDRYVNSANEAHE